MPADGERREGREDASVHDRRDDVGPALVVGADGGECSGVSRPERQGASLVSTRFVLPGRISPPLSFVDSSIIESRFE